MLGESPRCGQDGATSQRHATGPWLALRPTTPPPKEEVQGPVLERLPARVRAGRRGLLWAGQLPTDHVPGGHEVTGSETISAYHPLVCLR